MRWVWLVALGCVTRGELETALDRDGDGYQPVVAGGPDCDETRADVNPGAVEACGDGIDNDCDGFIDDAGLGERTWYLDDDDDGFGVDPTIQACSEPEGYAPVLGDCNDGDPGINPGVLDLCDGVDQDCDGRIDDDVDALVQYRDADEDGFGTDTDTLTGCGQTPGYVLVSGDCDDATSSINPAVEDTCDGVDQNCNGVVDEDVVFTVQYRDADSDGDGNPLDLISACELLPGYVGTANDCDDDDPHRYTNAFDHCDGIDQDCDGLIDDDVEFVAYYVDEDGDGAGVEPAVTESCTPVPTLVTTIGDCDDHDPTISPLLADTCDGVDSDCDGSIDDDALLTLYFPDADGDGVGTTLGAVEACIAPSAGFVQLDGDCDDHDPSIRPGTMDSCDGIDTDCDGAIDEDASFVLWWSDADADGVGTGPSAYTCDPPAGAASVDGDCDDGDPNVRPGLTDTCDGLDQDCDSAVDEDATFALWWTDGDGDGVGTGAPVYVCQAPHDAAQASGDCDDADPNVRPGIVDGCDGTDTDCDGVVDEDATFALWFQDGDGDGTGRTDSSVSTCDGAPSGYVSAPGDCDDTDGNVTIPVWFRDQDGDGWGIEDTLVGCSQPPGYVAQLGDCDDADDLRNPGFSEVCNNHRDDDCDPDTDCRRLGSLVPAQADVILPVPLDVTDIVLARGIVGSPNPALILSFLDRIEVHSDGIHSDFQSTPLWTIPDCTGAALSLDPAGVGTVVVCRDVLDTNQLRVHRRLETLPSLTFTATGAQLSSFEGTPTSGCGPGFWVSCNAGTLYIPVTSGSSSPSDAISTLDVEPFPHLEPAELVNGDGLLVQQETADLLLFDDSACPGVRGASDAVASVSLNASVSVVQHSPEYDQPVFLTYTFVPNEDPYADACTWQDPLSPSSLDPYSQTCFYGDTLSAIAGIPHGDLDGDGVREWLVALHASGGIVPLSVIYGVSGTDPDVGSSSFVLAVPDDGSHKILSPGDLNGDGFTDLAIHIRLATESNLYVFLGRGA